MDPIEWWLKPLAWVFARRPDWRDSFGRILLRIGNHFYVLLAIIFALTGAWDQFVEPIHPQLSDASFDWLMRQMQRKLLYWVPHEAESLRGL